jgi:hypothetical protein
VRQSEKPSDRQRDRKTKTKEDFYKGHRERQNKREKVKQRQTYVDRQIQKETERDRERQTETDRDRQSQTETDKDRQKFKNNRKLF